MINDVFKLFEGTKPIVVKLVFGVLGTDLYPEEMRAIRWGYADEFWRAAVAGMEARTARLDKPIHSR